VKYLRRPLPSPQGWTDNTPIVFRIPREHYLKRIKIHFELVLNQVSAGTALQDAPWSAIQRIDLVANGKDTIRSLSGFQIFEYNRWYYGVDATKTLGYALAVASGNNRVAGDIYLDLPPATAELLGILPTFRLSSLDLVILTGNGGTLSSAGTPTITAASSGFQVETDEVVRDAESDAYLGPLTEFITFQAQLVRNPLGTGDFDIDLPVGADYLNLLVVHRNGASVAAITNQGRADTVTREVKLLGDYVKVIADLIAQLNVGNGYQIGGAVDSEWSFDGGFQAQLRDAGVTMVDFLKGGADGSKRLTELDGRKWRALPVRSAEFATMTLRSTIQTFTTNAAIEVVPFRIFRLR
jgi:hypothetical protein